MTITIIKEIPVAVYKKGKPKILIDIDGVIVNYPFIETVKKHFGVDISGCIIYAYDLADVLGVDPIMINEMFREHLWGKPDFIPCALETLNEWKDRYQLIIFSNRVKYMGARNLAQWMVDNKIPFHGIENGDGEYYAHIDDSPAKLASTNSTVKYLYHQRWNASCYDILQQFKRVFTWSELKEAL